MLGVKRKGEREIKKEGVRKEWRKEGGRKEWRKEKGRKERGSKGGSRIEKGRGIQRGRKVAKGKRSLTIWVDRATGRVSTVARARPSFITDF